MIKEILGQAERTIKMPSDNGRPAHKQGEIKRLWAEIYDVEMGQFLLMPIHSGSHPQHTSCNSIPKKRFSLWYEIPLIATIIRIKRRITDTLRLRVIAEIEFDFSVSESPYARLVVDSCILIREGINEKHQGSNQMDCDQHGGAS